MFRNNYLDSTAFPSFDGEWLSKKKLERFFTSAVKEKPFRRVNRKDIQFYSDRFYSMKQSKNILIRTIDFDTV